MTSDSFPKVDGDIYYASEANASAYLGIRSSINTLSIISGIDAYLKSISTNQFIYYESGWNRTMSTFKDIIWDNLFAISTNNSNNNIYLYDFANSNNVVFSPYSTAKLMSNHLLTLAFDIDYTESTHLDFTAGSLPAGWVSTTAGASTWSWDAANDEYDFINSRPGADYGTNTLYYNTNLTEGTIIIGIRKISMRHEAGGTNEMTLSLGTSYIKIYDDTASGQHNKITDGVDSNDLGAFWSKVDDWYSAWPSDGTGVIWLKLTVRSDGSWTTQWSTWGNGNFVTLGNHASGGDTSGKKPTFTAYTTAPNGQHLWGSVYHFSINSAATGVYASSGNFVTTSTSTTNDIVCGGYILNKDTVANTTVNFYASADNGSNYELHSSTDLYHTFTNTGKNLKIKLALETTDTTVTPNILFYGYAYGQ